MTKLLCLGVALIALILPALANAATVRGVVVARESAHHTLVVSSAAGSVTTVRVTAKQARSTRLGTRLAATGARLADGSVKATRLVPAGKGTHARLAVVVVKVRGRRLLVAGGGSAFAVRLRAGARVLADAAPRLEPGDRVETEVEIGDDGVVGTAVQQVGQVPVIEFSGTVAAVGSDSVTIDSDGTTTVVQLPAGVPLPALVGPGVHVEVVATVSGATLTLATIEVDDEDAPVPSDQGAQVEDDGELRVEGTVGALGGGTLTVQPGEGSLPVVFAVPPTMTVPSSLAVGARVEARGEVVDGVLTLTRLEVQGGNGDSGEPAGGSRSGDDGGTSGSDSSGDSGSGSGTGSDSGSDGSSSDG